MSKNWKISLGSSGHNRSVRSDSEDENYFDPIVLPNSDSQSTKSKEDEEDDNNIDSREDNETYYDTRDSFGRRNADNPSPVPANSKVDNVPYRQLQDLAGLSSPSHEQRLAMEAIRNGEDYEDDDRHAHSVLSSLSSLSEDHHHHRTAKERLNSDESPLGDNIQSSNDHSSLPSIAIDDEPDNKESSLRKEVARAFYRVFGGINPSTLSPQKERSTSASTLTSPTKYINIRKFRSKQDPILSGKVKLAQILSKHDGPIWVVKFSPDGKYLCSAGQDTKVLIWTIGSFPISSSSNSSVSNLESDADNDDDVVSEDSKDESPMGSSNKQSDTRGCIISPEPYRVLTGHTADVIDISWSKSNFILTASLDKTVSLWVVTSSERIQYFRHPDIVTSVEFHPIHDRYFISGCFDRRLRFWDIIPDGHVRAWEQANETITSVCFSPDGQTVVGGLFNGQVYFYTFDMKYITQMDCRNSGGKYRNGKKVTGLTFIKREVLEETSSAIFRPKTANLREKLLVTTNDNRIRLIQTESYATTTKYRGLRNLSMQIKASLNEDGRYIICGSENGKVFLWHTNYTAKPSWLSMFSRHNRHTNQFYEYIYSTENSDIAVTSAVFAPGGSVYHVLANNFRNNRKKYYSTLAPDELKSIIDPILSKDIDKAEFSARIIAAADYDGKIRIYVREV